MENIGTPNEAQQEAKQTNKKLLEWAEKQGRSIIKHMELNKHPLTLGIHWKAARDGWLGGFMSGVSAGFQLGFKTASKMSQKFSEIDAAVVGTERQVIETRNAELKSFLGEAVGEASMCWSTPENAGTFDSTKAEAIVAKLYEKFARPLPEIQPSLPGL